MSYGMFALQRTSLAGQVGPAFADVPLLEDHRWIDTSAVSHPMSLDTVSAFMEVSIA